MTTTPRIERALSDPSVSFWLKNALRAALARDPVDASNDVNVLRVLIDEACDRDMARARQLLAQGMNHRGLPRNDAARRG